MAVHRAVSPKAPVVSTSTPKPATTLAELGGLAQQVTGAEAQRSKLGDEISSLKQDLKGAKEPKKTALEKQITELERRADQLGNQLADLGQAIYHSMQRLGGPRGGAKHNAMRDSALLSRIGSELGRARAEVTERRALKSTLEGQKPVSTARLADAKMRLAKAEATVAALDSASGLMTANLEVDQTNALKTAQQYDRADERQRDLVDVASMTREEQIKLVGAPIVNVSEDMAVKGDRSAVSTTTKANPANGAKMLARQLEHASPSQQLKLVKAAANHIKTIAASAGSSSVGEAYLKALSTAQGPARQLLLDAVLHSPSELKPLIGLLEKHVASGDMFEVAGELMKGLNAAGRTDEAGRLGKSVATSLSRLREQFETSKTKVDALNGKLSRATFGFGEAIAPEALVGFRDRYLQKHSVDYGAFENASRNYLRALEAAGSFPPATVVKEPKTPMELIEAQKAGPTLGRELTRLAGHSEALLESGAGQQMLAAAFSLQLEGKPSMLENLVADAKGPKSAFSFAKGTVDVVARTMVAFTARKGMDAVSKLIKANAGLLGISKEKVSTFMELVTQFNAKKLSIVDQEAALHTISEGGFGTSVKALGMLLAVPALLDGWSKSGSKSTLEQTKLVVDSLGLGNDLAKILLKPEVIQKLASKAGKALGFVAIPVEVLEGLTELFDGKTVDGSMSLASALGAGLMLVPGAQLAGAAIILGSAAAKHLWGDDPAERAELAAEAEVKDLLEFSGLKADTARLLSDVSQDGLRTMGPFISQMAKHLEMSPLEFMKHLDSMPKDKLKALVGMAKSMPDDGNWNFPADKTKTDDLDRSDVRSGAGFFYVGPKSLATAVEWMRKQGMLPRGK